MASTDARPIPRKNTAFRVYFPIFDADGDLVTGATGLDSEVSIDGAAFSDCTNEATEIGSTGLYYLDLTSSEMNGDAVVVQVKTSSSGAKTTPLIFYPEEVGDVRVNVEQFGGSNGTFSGGRPEVNTTHWGGTAVASAVVNANAIQISGDSTAADNCESFFDGTGYAGTNNVIPTVTTLTNLPAITANWLTAAGTAADFGTEVGAAVASALGTGSGFTAIPWNASWDAEVQSEVEDAIVVHRLDELLNADSDIDGLAPPTVGSVFHELMSKTAGSFTFDQTTDSCEALRDRGDAAWVTATGFSTHSAADVWSVATRSLTVLDEDSTTLDLDATIVSAMTTTLTTALSEGYRATNSTGSVRDILYEMLAFLTQFSISSTTYTSKKIDGTTTAKVYTINDATSPTAITETT